MASGLKHKPSADERVTVQARVDLETRDEARAAFKEMGMDMSTGINIYLKQVAREQRLPFTPSASDPLDATLAEALADVKAGRVERYEDFDSYKEAMSKL